MSADIYEAPRTHRPIIERKTYMPSHYTDHKDLSLPVRDEHDGLLGFTIGQVLPERRWAIRPDGRLLAELEFERLYKDWISRVVLKDGRIISITSVNKYFDVGTETIPGADEFVDAKPDPTRPGELRYVSIAYDPTAMLSRTKIRPLYNANGEKVVAGEAQPVPVEGFEPVAAPAPDMVTAACGKEVPAKRKNQHQSICHACKAALAEGAGAAA